MSTLFSWFKGLLGEIKASEDPLTEVISLIQQGQITKAEKLLRELVADMPANWTPVVESARNVSIAFWDRTEFLGYIAYQGSKSRQNITWLLPSYSKAFYYLAFIAVEQRDWSKAIQHIEKALSLEPDHPMLLCEKGLILGRMKRYGEALQLFLKAAEARPWTPIQYTARAMRGAGAALIDLERLEQAEEMLKKSLEIEPDNERAKNELIYIEHLRKGGARSDRYYLN